MTAVSAKTDKTELTAIMAVAWPLRVWTSTMADDGSMVFDIGC